MTEPTQTSTTARKGGGLSSTLLPELKALAGQLGINAASGILNADLVSATGARQAPNRLLPSGIATLRGSNSKQPKNLSQTTCTSPP